MRRFLACLLLLPLLSFADIQEAVSAHDAAVKKATETWRDAVQEILDDEIDKAEKDLADAKVAGNTSRQARAIAARQVYQKVADTLESGTPEFPSTIRREIRPAVETVKAQIDTLTAERDAALKSAESALHDAVRADLDAAGKPSDEAAIAAAIKETAASAGVRGAASPPAVVEGAAPPPSQGFGGGQPPAVVEPPSVYASNGESTSWAPLLGVAITVHDVDIVRIPVVNIRQRKTLTFQGGYGDIPAAITPRQNVLEPPPANAPLAFRATNLPGFPAPEIVEWPSEANKWTLQLRCRPGDDPDNKPNAFTLEVDAKARTLVALNGDEVSATKTDDVAVQLDTRPSGAVILVDGRPLRTPDGKPLRTPCEVLLPATGASLELRLSGYLPKILPKAVPPKNGQPVTIPLARDPDHIDKTVEIKASSASALTGIQLKQGRKYRIRIEGQWSCDPAKTLVDAAGYPLGDHPAFYTDPVNYPRLTTDANYGALLYTIGKNPAWKPLPAAAILTAESSGPLRLDINEGGGPKNRTNNSGSLKLHILSL